MSGLTVKADNEASKEENKETCRGNNKAEEKEIRQWRIYDQIGDGVIWVVKNKRKAVGKRAKSHRE